MNEEEVRKMKNVVAKESKISGKGVFAARSFKKDEEVLEIDDSHVVLDASTLTKEQYEFECDYLANGKIVFMQAPERYINHSCDPNTWMKDEVTSTARRNIKANEELTIDYATYIANENRIIIEKCKCGSANCRKRITGRDWRRRDLQEQYRGHFLPIINKRIATQQARSKA
jgi:SET domain-containing protein